MNSKKTITLLACIGSILTFGESNTKKQEIQPQNNTQTEMLTLIGKKMIYAENPNNDRASLFFDTDGNTNTTEIVARVSMCEAKAEARIFDAKIGETKTKEEWAKQIPLSSALNIFTPWIHIK